MLNSQQVFLLKADVEGFEAAVVKGAQTMFSTRPPPVMLIEYVPSFIAKAGFNGPEFLQRLHGLGYLRHNPWNNDNEPVAIWYSCTNRTCRTYMDYRLPKLFSRAVGLGVSVL